MYWPSVNPRNEIRKGSSKSGGMYIRTAFAESLPTNILIVKGERIIKVSKTTPSIMAALIRRGSVA
jgi:hypothetical protein